MRAQHSCATIIINAEGWKAKATANMQQRRKPEEGSFCPSAMFGEISYYVYYRREEKVILTIKFGQNLTNASRRSKTAEPATDLVTVDSLEPSADALGWDPTQPFDVPSHSKFTFAL